MMKNPHVVANMPKALGLLRIKYWAGLRMSGFDSLFMTSWYRLPRSLVLGDTKWRSNFGSLVASRMACCSMVSLVSNMVSKRFWPASK